MGPAMSRRNRSLAVSPPLRPTRILRRNLIGINGITGVRKWRSLKLCPARHRELGRVIRFNRRPTRPRVTRLMRLILRRPRLAYSVIWTLEPMRTWFALLHLVLLGINYVESIMIR